MQDEGAAPMGGKGGDVERASGQGSPVASRYDLTRSECWTRALAAFGTAYIFEQRAAKLGRWLRILAFVSVVVPVIVGGLALSYGAQFTALPLIIVIGSAFGIAQLVISTWSIAAGWVDAYAYAIESVASNKAIYLKFKELARNPPAEHGELYARVQLVQVEDDARRDQDYKRGITDREKRMAMRAGLRELGKKCASCGKIPHDMNPTNCGVCGDF